MKTAEEWYYEGHSYYKSGKKKKAVECFEMASDMGNIEAKVFLACYYGLKIFKGSKTQKRIYELTREAYEGGSNAAITLLANCYEYGEGVEKDYNKAIYLLKKAAECGEESEEYCDERILNIRQTMRKKGIKYTCDEPTNEKSAYGSTSNIIEANKSQSDAVLKRKAESGDVEAMIELAYKLCYGNNANEKSRCEAIDYCKQAINAGTNIPFPYHVITSEGIETLDDSFEEMSLSEIREYIKCGEDALSICKCENEKDKDDLLGICVDLGNLYLSAGTKEVENWNSEEGYKNCKIARSYFQKAQEGGENVKELIEITDKCTKEAEYCLQSEKRLAKSKALDKKIDSIINNPLLNMIPGFSVGAAMYNAGRAIGDAIIDRDVNKASQGVVDGINTIKGLRG